MKKPPPVLEETPVNAQEPVKPTVPAPIQAEVTASSFKPSFKKTRAIDHHVAKLLEAITVKNKSYKKFGYIPFEQKHAHVWHSISSHSGAVKTHCEPMLGHTHAVEIVEKGGEYIINCGPAVVQSTIRTDADNRSKGYKRKLLRGIVKDEDGQTVQEPMFDDHIHEVKYLKSEKLEINI